MKDRIVFIKHEGVAARVTKNVKVPLEVEKDGNVYTEEKDIGGFYVISPDVKAAKEKKAEEKTPEKSP